MIEEIYKVYKITNCNSYGKRVYEVSNQGNVKLNGELIDFSNWNHGPYYYFGGGYMVHRAVAELFIPNPYNKTCVDHIDTNSFNNSVDNLRWVTHKENSNNKLTKQHISINSKGISKSESHKQKLKAYSPYSKGKHRVYDNIERTKYHYE